MPIRILVLIAFLFSVVATPSAFALRPELDKAGLEENFNVDPLKDLVLVNLRGPHLLVRGLSGRFGDQFTPERVRRILKEGFFDDPNPSDPNLGINIPESDRGISFAMTLQSRTRENQNWWEDPGLLGGYLGSSTALTLPWGPFLTDSEQKPRGAAILDPSALQDRRYQKQFFAVGSYFSKDRTTFFERRAIGTELLPYELPYREGIPSTADEVRFLFSKGERNTNIDPTYILGWIVNPAAAEMLIPLLQERHLRTPVYDVAGGLVYPVESSFDEVFAHVQSQSGLEETARLAQTIRKYRLLGTSASDPRTDQEVVRELIWQWTQPPGQNAPSNVKVPLMDNPSYRPGPFSRDEMEGHWVKPFYLEDDWLPSLQRVVLEIGHQIGIESDKEVRRLLNWPVLEQFLRSLFEARDGNGRLWMAGVDDAICYRWIYREIPRLLLPAVADSSVDQHILAQALENPFRNSNNAGNHAMMDAVWELIHRQPADYVESPSVLQEATPQERVDLLMNWLRLLLASNLMDYSRESIVQEIRQAGDLAQYILRFAQTPFVDLLGADRYAREFLEQISDPEHPQRLVHFPDNNTEVVVSLKFAELLLSANPNLSIVFVPKADNGVMNDASMQDVERLLAAPESGQADVLRILRGYQTTGRFRLLAGPATHGTPLQFLSDEVAEAVEAADVILVEGEANTWTFNGLDKEMYVGLRLKWPEGLPLIFGLQESDLTPEERAARPPAFFRARGIYYQNPLGVGQLPRVTVRDTVEEDLRSRQAVGSSV